MLRSNLLKKRAVRGQARVKQIDVGSFEALAAVHATSGALRHDLVAELKDAQSLFSSRHTPRRHHLDGCSPPALRLICVTYVPSVPVQRRAYMYSGAE